MDTLVSSTDEAPLENSILSIEESGSGTLSTENMLRQVLQAVQALHDSVLRIAQPRQEGNVSNSRSSNISGDSEGQGPMGKGVSIDPPAGTTRTQSEATPEVRPSARVHTRPSALTFQTQPMESAFQAQMSAMGYNIVKDYMLKACNFTAWVELRKMITNNTLPMSLSNVPVWELLAPEVKAEFCMNREMSPLQVADLETEEIIHQLDLFLAPESVIEFKNALFKVSNVIKTPQDFKAFHTNWYYIFDNFNRMVHKQPFAVKYGFWVNGKVARNWYFSRLPSWVTQGAEAYGLEDPVRDFHDILNLVSDHASVQTYNKRFESESHVLNRAPDRMRPVQRVKMTPTAQQEGSSRTRNHAICTYCGRGHPREQCWFKGLPGVRSSGEDTSIVVLSKETLEKYKDTITKNKEQAQGREAKSNFHKTKDFAHAQGNHTFKSKSPGSSHMVLSVLDLHQGVDPPTEESNASIKAYTLEVQLYNRTVRALIDTGATVNVISKSFFQQLQSDNFVHSYPCSQKIALAGAPATEARQACHLNFHVFVEYGIETSDLFYILDPAPYPLIFGLQLFTFFRLDKLLWRIENGRVNPLPSAQDPVIPCDVPAPIESIQEPELKKAIEDLLQNTRYDSILSYKDLSTPAKFPCFTITLKPEARPRFGRRVPIQAKHVPAVEKWIDKSLQEGLISPLEDRSPSYLGYLVCAPKAGTSDDLRICTALMELNEDTLLEAVYLPPLLDAARCLAGHKYMGKLDCKSLFNQFEIREKDQLLTAFRTPKGAYYCKRLPFGLINGTFHAQKCLFDMLEKAGLNPNLPSENPVVIYVDDIGFASDTSEGFLNTLRAILDACAESNLKISPTKMHFSSIRMHFVGFSISTRGLEIADNRKMAFRQMKPPRDRSELKSFLGLINWFSPFLKELALIAAPLHDLTKKNTPFTWTEAHQAAWDSIIETCLAAPILHPVDANYPLCIYADASNKGSAALLVQLEPFPRCIEMISKKFTEAERR